jgi:hypothetical protein
VGYGFLLLAGLAFAIALYTIQSGFVLIAFAGLTFLGAIYTSYSGFAVLKKSGLINAARIMGWLTTINVLLALPLAPATITLHFMMPHYSNSITTVQYDLYGLGGPVLLFAIVHFGIKSLPAFRVYPAKLWKHSTISGILFGWSAWSFLSYFFLTS